MSRHTFKTPCPCRTKTNPPPSVATARPSAWPGAPSREGGETASACAGAGRPRPRLRSIVTCELSRSKKPGAPHNTACFARPPETKQRYRGRLPRGTAPEGSHLDVGEGREVARALGEGPGQGRGPGQQVGELEEVNERPCDAIIVSTGTSV